MYKVLYKLDHNSDILSYNVRAKYDRDSIVDTLIECGSLVMSSGFFKSGV